MRKLLVVPMFMAAVAIIAAPAAPEELGGPRLHAAACYIDWKVDSAGTLYCKDAGRNCHAPCPAEQ